MKKTTNDTAISELHFANLQVAHLMSALDELHSFTGTLERKVIDNAKERYELDRLIHAKVIHNRDLPRHHVR